MDNKRDTFAAKLNRLFEEKLKPNGSPYTQTEVVAKMKNVLSRVQLWKLRTGQADNPGIQVIQALADFFRVEPSYFFEHESPEIDEKEQKRNEFIEQIALRSYELDESGKQAVIFMIDSIVKSKKETKK
jgi:transcriptional regulator with XRE-family HTH domain